MRKHADSLVRTVTESRRRPAVTNSVTSVNFGIQNMRAHVPPGPALAKKTEEPTSEEPSASEIMAACIFNNQVSLVAWFPVYAIRDIFAYTFLSWDYLF